MYSLKQLLLNVFEACVQCTDAIHKGRPYHYTSNVHSKNGQFYYEQ